MEKLSEKLWFSNNLKSAILVYIVSVYGDVGEMVLGRTIMQKICYFLTFLNIPLPYHFKIYQYGPFSQELYNDMEMLDLDGVIEDTGSEGSSIYKKTEKGDSLLERYKSKLDPIKHKIEDTVNLIKGLGTKDLELFSTTHFAFWAYKNVEGSSPEEKVVIKRVVEIKGDKYSKENIKHAFSELERVGLLG